MRKSVKNHAWGRSFKAVDEKLRSKSIQECSPSRGSSGRYIGENHQFLQKNRHGSHTHVTDG